MEDNEIASLKAELKGLQDQIIERKRDLAKKNEEKERWFQKRAEIGSHIAERIRQVKEQRAKRDELTTMVQQEKVSRRNFSKEIRDKIAEVKTLREQRKKEREKAGVLKSPGLLKQEIEKIEFRMETQPMPYNEERRVMKTLKEKKALLEKYKSSEQLTKRIRALSKEIDQLKKQSDEVHELLQETAGESQEFHTTVLETSKEIDDLKAEEDEAYKKFAELKDAYAALRDELQSLIDRADAIRKTLSEHGEEVAALEKRKTKEILKEKTKAVEEKVKKKQKLTTEDLLAFQAGE